MICTGEGKGHLFPYNTLVFSQSFFYVKSSYSNLPLINRQVLCFTRAFRAWWGRGGL